MAKRKVNSSRADEDRRNHHQQIRKSSKKDVDRYDAPEHRMPPVMARTSYDTRSLSGKKTKKTPLKRRFDISLSKAGSQGVEMRLPSVPIVHPGWRVLSFLILVCGLLLLNYLLTSPVFKVKSIQVEGVLRLSVEEITRTLGVRNKTIFLLNPLQMEEKLTEAYIELTNVSVKITLPAQIMVRVNERVPMVAWVMDNETLWIDGNGFIFPPRGEAEKLVSIIADAPPPMTILNQPIEQTDTVGDEELQSFMPQVYINAIFILKKQAPEGTTLIYDASHGFGWTDPGGWQVFFGTEINDIDSKLNVYYAVVDKLEGEGITPSIVSVAFLHAPYYR